MRAPPATGSRAVGDSLDAGLVRGAGVGGLAANIINYVVGASIFAMPATAAALAARWTPVAFLIAAIANAAIAICYAEASMRVAASGGQATFTEAAFGRYAGFVVGVLTYVSGLTAAGAVLAAAADAVAAMTPALAAPAIRAILILGWAAVLVLINVRGVRSVVRSVEIAVAVKLIPLILFVIVAAGAIDGRNLSLPSLPAPPGLGKATLLAVFLFAGVHGPLIAGGEIRDPARTLPRGIFLATGCVTALYIAIELVAQGVLGADLARSKQPLAAAISHVSPALAGVLLAGALLSMLGWTLSEVFAAPRLLFAFAREGYLPGAIGRLNGRKVPANAILLHVALISALAIAGSFSLLATLAALIMAVLFIAAAVAALRLRLTGIAASGEMTRMPGLWPAALVSIGVMLWIAAQATLLQATGLVAIVALASMAFASRRRPVDRSRARVSGPAPEDNVASTSKSSSGLLRVLGTAFALAVGLGNMIGSGMFRSPGTVVAHTGSVHLAVLLIVAVGVQSLLSANLWAEVSTSVALSGGSVVVARRAFGDTAAMVIGWTDALSCIAGTAQAAAGAPIFLAIIAPAIAPEPRLIAAVLLIVFSLINWRGVVAGERTQMIASLIQVTLVIGIIVLLFIVGSTAGPASSAAGAPMVTAGGVIIGYQLIYGTYVGWNNAAYFAEETNDLGRAVPRALVWSVVAFGALYFGMVVGLGHALPLATLSGATFPAQLALSNALGVTGVKILSAVAFAVLVTCMNSGIMPSTRVLFALGKASYGPRFLTSVNGGGTPDLALLVFASLTVVLVLTGRYETIFMLMGTLALAVTAAMDLSFFQLRRREPELHRPYRAIGYPLLPALALILDLAILLMIALSDLRSTFFALLTAGVGCTVALTLCAVRRRNAVTIMP